MQIGPYKLKNNLALAPMVGVTDRFFRGLCRDLGAGYVVSEMLAADPALRDTRVARLRGDFSGEASPIAVQIAGSEPDWLAEAARYNVSRGAEIIDINMGCPAKKVCNKLAGSALLSQPRQVRAILEAVVAAVEVPVTLKIRTGPNPRERNGVEIAHLAESCGIAALAVHGRTRSDRFKGAAEYQTIRDICSAVSIPVFANGDIDSPLAAAKALSITGADGLMIGRAAQGNPWIFREIGHYLEHGRYLEPPQPLDVLRVMERHLCALRKAYGEAQGVRVARKHIGWYLHGRAGAEAVRRQLMRVETAAEQLRLLRDYFAQQQANADATEKAGQLAA
jgi:tRNA-dihydrouridine synthase B